ncbi:hypothetical protein M413DRAFT_448982 [Hebeloma cylindrosporum]|uniref:Uncharacterized protein n=1 Tax=Hebeloma cylindrosporum TaxID=76867 RepID=A0A0C3BIX3_HEBCY|nr:hypothetical protein M413DRAFT_448982 [Hebeloma cylindrosporum h7]
MHLEMHPRISMFPSDPFLATWHEKKSRNSSAPMRAQKSRAPALGSYVLKYGCEVR